MRNGNKSIFAGVVLYWLVLLACTSLHATESDAALIESFSKHVKSVEEGRHYIQHVIAESIDRDKIKISDLSEAVQKIRRESVLLLAIGEKNNKHWIYEAHMIEEDTHDIEAMIVEKEYEGILRVLNRISYCVKTMELLFPAYLVVVIEENLEGINNEVLKLDNDWEDVELYVESLLILSRQLDIAADAFGKKIWKKFSTQLWQICRELDDVAEEESESATMNLLEKAYNQLDILKKLVM